MKIRAFFICVAFLLPPPSVVYAQVYKCKGANGKVAYQETPCPNGESETRPSITKEPTLTDEERFNAAAYAAGVTPAEARRLLSGKSQARDNSELTQSPTSSLQMDRQVQQRRENDCNNRYDELAAEAKKTFSSSMAKGNLARHLEQIESERTSCLYGQANPVENSLGTARNERMGQCQGQCSSEQGICSSQCQGNGACIANCGAAQGRCIAACSR